MLKKVKKYLQNKQTKRVNKLAENVKAGRPVTKASLKNLIELVRRYKQANYGKGRKLTKKVVLGNINNMKKTNAFRNNFNNNNFIRNVEAKRNISKYKSNNLLSFIVGHRNPNYGPYYYMNNNNTMWLNNNGQVPTRARLEKNARVIAYIVLEER
jgi:hypothetical protein